MAASSASLACVSLIFEAASPQNVLPPPPPPDTDGGGVLTGGVDVGVDDAPPPAEELDELPHAAPASASTARLMATKTRTRDMCCLLVWPRAGRAVAAVPALLGWARRYQAVPFVI